MVLAYASENQDLYFSYNKRRDKKRLFWFLHQIQPIFIQLITRSAFDIPLRRYPIQIFFKINKYISFFLTNVRHHKVENI